MSQFIFQPLGRAVGCPRKSTEGSHIDEGAPVECADIQRFSCAGIDADGGAVGIVAKVETGGKIIGAAAGDISDGWRSFKLYSAGDHFVESPVAPEADNAVKGIAILQNEAGGIAPGSGLPHADEIAGLAEAADDLKERCGRPRSSGTGVDDEKEFLFHGIKTFLHDQNGEIEVKVYANEV